MGMVELRRILLPTLKNNFAIGSDYMARDNVPMTSEKRERIPLQAERAANFIFYAHTLSGVELILYQ
jgi:hypothetical protein